MLTTHLFKPVYFDSQIPEIVESLKNTDLCPSEDDIRRLLAGQNCFIKEENGKICFAGIQTDADVRAAVEDNKKDIARYYCGCDAISFLLEHYKTKPVRSYDELTIPVEVFRECDASAWHDISILFATVIERSRRAQKMYELEAPFIIQAHEDRMLWKCVNLLEDNQDYPKNGFSCAVRPNNTPRRSLADIGYSIVHGWSDDMLMYFKDREAKWREELKNSMENGGSDDE